MSHSGKEQRKGETISREKRGARRVAEPRRIFQEAQVVQTSLKPLHTLLLSSVISPFGFLEKCILDLTVYWILFLSELYSASKWDLRWLTNLSVWSKRPVFSMNRKLKKQQKQQNQKSAYPGLSTETSFDCSESSLLISPFPLLCCKLPESLSFALNGPIASLFPRLDRTRLPTTA